MADLRLTLYLQPGAKRTECVGMHGAAMKLRVAAPPVDGKANAALIEFVAGRLGVAPSRVTIDRGLTSRHKCVRIRDCALTAAAAQILLVGEPT